MSPIVLYREVKESFTPSDPDLKSRLSDNLGDVRDFRDFALVTGLSGRSENEAVNGAVVYFFLSLGGLHNIPYVPEVHRERM